MTTAESIEGITDAGKFEILATRVLRIEDEDCRFLEHLGENATGKTISSSLDAFCLIPGSKPPRFVMAAFTTAAPKKLKRKWLFDHRQASRTQKATAKDDGDLVKAARHAEALRKDHSDAEFVVHLCTNRCLRDDKLRSEVYKKAEEFRLTPVFLEQSRIRDCLDMKPEGQWLRKEHLGIQAELLSLSLLKSLSVKSLQGYSQEFFITPPNLKFVTTAIQRALGESIRREGRAVHIVSGASGSGKSVASYQVLREHIESGGIGLWIPGEIAARASSFEEAVETTLHSLYPTIQNGAGAVALGLATPQHALLLVVDDVNRGGDPTTTMRKLVPWARPLPSTEENDTLPSRWSVIIPVWDVFWAPLDPMYRSSTWLSRIPLSRMSENEALQCLQCALGAQAGAFLEAQLHQLVETLGYDPILIAMFGELFRNSATGNVDTLAHEVMKRFISSARAEAASSGSYIEADYQEALLALARSMLQHRELYPLWSDVTRWLTDQQAAVVRRLVALGKICRVTERSVEPRFEFRHDRILEYYLASALGAMLEAPSEHVSVLSDPFYATFLGRAIATTGAYKHAVSWVRTHSPLALIAAIRFLTPENNATSTTIVKTAREWLTEAARDPATPPTLLYESYRLLAETDSPFVIEITESLDRNWYLCHARLANGDAMAGARAFADRSNFRPATNAPYLDHLLERALRHHRHALISGCQQMLERADLQEAERIGALTLAGFIGADELANSIRVAWDSTRNKHNILLAALWAGVRCGEWSPSTLLDSMVTVWSSLPDEHPNASLSNRERVADQLRFAVRRGISTSVLCYLVDIATRNKALRSLIAYMLKQVNHPVAVRYLVMLAAEAENRAEREGNTSLWSLILQHDWDATRNLGYRLSGDALNAIRALWESPVSEGSLKKTAFAFWVNATDDSDALRAIPPEHPQFKDALRRRTLLGDFTAIPYVKAILGSDTHWFYVIAHTWCAEFWHITDQALLTLREQTPTDFSGGQTNGHYILANLLRDIPGEEAEKLLVKHWDHLWYSKHFVQVALYLSTEQCTALANMALQKWPPHIDAFEHLGMFFGFSTLGLSDRLSLAQLETLQPYLKQLDIHTMMQMAEFCVRHGYREWADRYLRPELDRRRAELEQQSKDRDFLESMARHHFPTDTDLLKELDWIEQQQHPEGHIRYIGQWCKEFERRQDDPSRSRRLLEQWLAQSPSVARLKIVGNAVLRNGSRQDLQLLTKYHIEGSQEQLERLRADVRFAVMRRSLN